MLILMLRIVILILQQLYLFLCCYLYNVYGSSISCLVTEKWLRKKKIYIYIFFLTKITLKYAYSISTRIWLLLIFCKWRNKLAIFWGIWNPPVWIFFPERRKYEIEKDKRTFEWKPRICRAHLAHFREKRFSCYIVLGKLWLNCGFLWKFIFLGT